MKTFSQNAAADLILAKFEAYLDALDDMIELCDGLACAFDSNSPQFSTMLNLVDGFCAHNHTLRSENVARRIKEIVDDYLSRVSLDQAKV